MGKVRKSRAVSVGTAALTALVLTGCGMQPRPPELRQGEEVFRSDRDGFQFRPPPGWSQNALSDIPPGPLTQERLLVKYKRPTVGNRTAFLRVTAEELPGDRSLMDYLRRRGYGREWGKPLKFEDNPKVGGLPAVRVTCAGYWDTEKMVKEVLAVARGGRVYYFTGIYADAEQKEVRDILRTAIASVAWDPEAGTTARR